MKRPITVSYTKKPDTLRRVLRLLLVLLDLVIQPRVLVPVAAFVAGFSLALILSCKWKEGDREYTKALEERIQALENKP
jgi:hypothetical protein